MPQIVLSRLKVEALIAFCKVHKSEQYFVAKDQGAYVGYSVGAERHQQCLFYFEGCDPRMDADFLDNADAQFGCDAVGYHFPVDDLRNVLEVAGCKLVRISLLGRRLSIAAGR